MPPSFVTDDGDDDDGFGEFKFVNNNYEEDDEDWGDFVQSPQAHSNSNSSNNHWEKPRGAIPLSIFGVIEEEDDEQGPPDLTQLLFHNYTNGFSSPSFPSPAHADPKNLIRDHVDDDSNNNRDDGNIKHNGMQAENGLRASIEPFRPASLKEQEDYIVAWSTIAHACAKELHHGAMIWKESIDANVSKEILSRGMNYFAALVEIYRVSEILRASLKLYKPWMLSTLEDHSKELISSLEKCAETWTTYGMGKTLESTFAATPDFGYLLSDNGAFEHDSVICKLSLLPMDKLQGVKVVTWNGHHYCLWLANFWANRVSCCPPQLPHLAASQFQNRADKF